MSKKRIFCDESGFTGPDLLNPEQRFFAYSSVQIDAEEAGDLVSRVRTDFRLQAPELKGSQLLKSRNGKRAALRVFDAMVNSSITVVANKRFALAGKLFEYIFEPGLKTVNQLLYDRGFHKFVANLLYIHLQANDTPVTALLEAFQAGVRARDFSILNTTFAGLHSSAGAKEFASLIGKFCMGQASAIEAELASTGMLLVDKWGLDLTATCLTGLLALWADRNLEISLVLDDSKPLQAWWDVAKDLYVVRPGTSGPGEYVTVEGRTNRVTFSLSSVPEFACSTITAGLQLADVLAAVVSNAFQTRELPESQELLMRAMEGGAIDGNCMFPDLDYVDPASEAVQANQQLLWALIARSIQGVPLTRNFSKLLSQPGIRL